MMNNEPNLDRMFHALADGHRRAMVERLAGGPLSVSDLAGPLNISLPAVMQHLGVLETCGLVRSAKQGRVRTCTLDPAAIAAAENWLGARRALVQNRLDGLEKYLQSEGDTP